MRLIRLTLLAVLFSAYFISTFSPAHAQTTRTKQVVVKCATSSRLSGANETIIFKRCSDGADLVSSSGGAFTVLGGGSSGGTASDVFSARPAASTAGLLFFPTNALTIERDTGSAWASWGPTWPLVQPPASGWSWVNQDSAAVDETLDHFYLEYTATSATAGDNVALRCRTAPATPYTITAAFIPNNLRTTSGAGVYMYEGLAFRETATSKLESWFVVTNPFASGGLWLSVSTWTSATALSAELARYYSAGKQIWWLRINADGTNLKYYLSSDGVHFHLYISRAKATFFTTAPDQVCYAVGDAAGVVAADKTAMSLISWKVE